MEKNPEVLLSALPTPSDFGPGETWDERGARGGEYSGIGPGTLGHDSLLFGPSSSKGLNSSAMSVRSGGHFR